MLHLLQFAALVCFGTHSDHLAKSVDYLLEFILHVSIQKDVYLHNKVLLQMQNLLRVTVHLKIINDSFGITDDLHDLFLDLEWFEHFLLWILILLQFNNDCIFLFILLVLFLKIDPCQF